MMLLIIYIVSLSSMATAFYQLYSDLSTPQRIVNCWNDLELTFVCSCERQIKTIRRITLFQV
jgi:hypothetical protein